MSTARTCTTPKEGWSLVSHFLGNFLLNTHFVVEELGRKDEKLGRIIDESRAQLVGYLYMIVRQMTQNGHEDEALKMKQIIDLVIDGDLTDMQVLILIEAKHKELDPRVRAFEEALAKLNAEHAR